MAENTPTPRLVLVPVEPSEEMIEAGVKDHRREQSYEGAEETYRAMLSAVPPLSDEVVNWLCRAYSATGIRAPEVEEWWEPNTKHMHRDELRDRDRARMRAFVAKLSGGCVMPSERDPRVDPRPGDVLCHGPGTNHMIAVTVSGADATAVSWQAPWIPAACSDIAAWRTWAKTATIIHKAGDAS